LQAQPSFIGGIMGAAIMVAVLFTLVAAGLAIWLIEPKSKSLQAEKEDLQLEVKHLKKQLQQKEDELAVLRWGMPWQVTDKEPHGSQE
jgi:hypothetical protein